MFILKANNSALVSIQSMDFSTSPQISQSPIELLAFDDAYYGPYIHACLPVNVIISSPFTRTETWLHNHEK